MAFSGFGSFTAGFGLGFYPIKRKPTRKRLTDFKKKSECEKTVMLLTRRSGSKLPRSKRWQLGLRFEESLVHGYLAILHLVEHHPQHCGQFVIFGFADARFRTECADIVRREFLPA